MDETPPKHIVCVCQMDSQADCKQSTLRWSMQRQLPILAAEFQGTAVQTLIDSGSMLPLLAEQKYRQLKPPPKFSHDTLNAFGCNGSALNIIGKVQGSFRFVQHDTAFQAQFYVLQDASSPCIIPSTWLKAFQATLDYNLLALTYTLPRRDFVINVQGQFENISQQQLDCESEKKEVDTESRQDLSCVPAGDAEQADSSQSTPSGQQATVVKVVKPKTTVCFTLKACPLWPRVVVLPNGAGWGFVRPNKTKSRQILTLRNQSDSSVQIDLKQPLRPPPYQSTRTVALSLDSWRDSDSICAAAASSTLLVHEGQEGDPFKTWQERQSAFDHSRKTLDFLPVSGPQINFLIPDKATQHPFGHQSDPLSVLYMYLLYLVGTNLQYPRLNETQLGELIQRLGKKLHRKVYRKLYNLYQANKVQDMYVNLTKQIIYCVHLSFKSAEAKTSNCKLGLTGHSLQGRLRTIHSELVDSIHCWSALCFLNQLLVNRFYSQTLQHPFFRKLTLPQSLDEAIQNANTNTNQNTNTNTNVVSAALLDQKFLERHTIQELAQVNTDKCYQPKELNFQQFCHSLHQDCDEYAEEYDKEMQSSRFSGSEVSDISQIPTPLLQSYVQYCKSSSRLRDFAAAQFPSLNETGHPPGAATTVQQLLDNMQLPKYVMYSSEEEIIQDYIPNCLRVSFSKYFQHFSDVVFVKFSSEFALPYPPNDQDMARSPPDPLHEPSGLVDPKLLAATTCQILDHQHPLLTNPVYKLELVKLACVLFVWGQTAVSLHSQDTGWFNSLFQVKTLLAPNAPSSSIPVKQASEIVCPDLDDRISYLMKQGKCVQILGSPFQAQLSAVPKSYKTGRVLESCKTDPVLQYISGLSEDKQLKLSQYSQEIKEKQEQLIGLLEQGENSDVIASSVTSAPTPNVSQKFGLTIQPHLIGLAITDLQNQDHLDFISSCPPSPTEQSSFFQRMRRKTTRSRQKLKFGRSFWVFVDDPGELKEARMRVSYSKFYPEYFLSGKDFLCHKERTHPQAIACKYRAALAAPQSQKNSPELGKPPINYIGQMSPNIQQLARHKLPLNISDHQRYLANCNTMHFAIEQFSSQAPFNRIPESDGWNYALMKSLQKGDSISHAHLNSPTNLAKHDLLNICISSSAQYQDSRDQNLFGRVQISRPSQLFSELVNGLICYMRRLDHKKALKSVHSLKKNTMEVLEDICPEFSSSWDQISVQQVFSKFPDWEGFLEAISNHYQIPTIWLFVTIRQSTIQQNCTVDKVLVLNAALFQANDPRFTILAISELSSEICRVRGNNDTCATLIQFVQSGRCSKTMQYEDIQTVFDNEPCQEEGVSTNKPRYSRVTYPHLGKTFYRKNLITRVILNSQQTNKLTRKANHQIQSQHDIIKNLGSSKFFSSFDLTACYDGLPSCPVSSLISTAAYRQKEFAFLIASQVEVIVSSFAREL